MAKQGEQPIDDCGEIPSQTETKKYVSERGPFKIFSDTKVNPPTPREKINTDKSADGFEHSALAKKFGEEKVRQKIGEMVKAFIPGASTTPLFIQNTPNGMSLVHVWFGPNFPLFRHSHPAYGDCLYYVVAGEIILGNQKLGPGAGFFVPNGQPYKYTAGPEGVELLEFRAGGGIKGAPGMKLDETSLDSMQRIIDGAHANEHLWQAPKNIGDTAYMKPQKAEADR